MSLVELLVAATIAALIVSGLIRAFVAQGEFQARWLETRNAERAAGAAIEILARAVEAAGYRGCRSGGAGLGASWAGEASVTSSGPAPAVVVMSSAEGDSIVTHRVVDPLPVSSFSSSGVLVRGRWSKRPRAGQRYLLASCRGDWSFPLGGIRLTSELSVAGVVRQTMLSGNLSRAPAVVAGRDDELARDASIVPPGGTTVGAAVTSRYFVEANDDDGRSLWLTTNGGRPSELVRGIDRLTVQRLGDRLVRLRVAGGTAGGTGSAHDAASQRVFRERVVVIRNG